MRLSLAADDLFIVPPKWFFVKPYFLEAFELSELGALQTSQCQPWACRGETPPSCFRKTAPFAWTPHWGDSLLSQPQSFSASIGSFQGLPAETLEVILLPQRLALKYNTTPPPPCQHFLTDFFILFCARPETTSDREVYAPQLLWCSLARMPFLFTCIMYYKAFAV